MTHSVAWYDESILLYAGVRITGVGMHPEQVTAYLGLIPTRTQAPAVMVERDLDGTDLDIDIPAAWIRERHADPSPGLLLSQVDATLRELEATGISFRGVDNAEEFQFCIGVLPGANKRASISREEPLHELDQRIDALGLTLAVRVVYPGMATGIAGVAARSDTHWLDHGELRYIHVSFSGPTLSPTDVTTAIGLSPSEVREPGVETDVDLDGMKQVRMIHGRWSRMVRTDPTPGLFVAQVENLLTELEEAGDACRALCAVNAASICLGISLATNEMRDETRGDLPWTIMRRADALGLSFSMRVEFPGD